MTLGDELSIFAAASDDDRVMDATSKLEVSLSNTYNRVSWHARDLLGPRGREGLLQAALKEHARATAW